MTATLEQNLADVVRQAVEDALAEQKPPPIVYTRDEAAHVLGVSTSHLDTMRRRGQLEPVSYSERPLFARADVHALVSGAGLEAVPDVAS